MIRNPANGVVAMPVVLWGVLIVSCIIEYGELQRDDQAAKLAAKECEVVARVFQVARDMQAGSAIAIDDLYDPRATAKFQADEFYDKAGDVMTSLVLENPERYAPLARAVGAAREYIENKRERSNGESFPQIYRTAIQHLSLINAEATNIVDGHSRALSATRDRFFRHSLPLIMIAITLVIFLVRLLSQKPASQSS